jgi:hypothetical protein
MIGKKKVIDFPVPSRDVNNQTLPGREKFNNYLFSASESLVIDIPAGDGKIEILFFQCISLYVEEAT